MSDVRAPQKRYARLFSATNKQPMQRGSTNPERFAAFAPNSTRRKPRRSRRRAVREANTGKRHAHAAVHFDAELAQRTDSFGQKPFATWLIDGWPARIR